MCGKSNKYVTIQLFLLFEEQQFEAPTSPDISQKNFWNCSSCSLYLGEGVGSGTSIFSGGSSAYLHSRIPQKPHIWQNTYMYLCILIILYALSCLHLEVVCKLTFLQSIIYSGVWVPLCVCVCVCVCTWNSPLGQDFAL